MEINIITSYQEVWLLSQLPTSPAYVIPNYRAEVVYPHAGKVWLAPARRTLSAAQRDAAYFITGK